MRIIHSFVLLFVLLTMEACISPLYKPLSPIGLFGKDLQGYFEYKIDDQTYLIGYSNYVSAPPIVIGDWRVRNMNSFLKGTREYAFYRAAEFTKSKGRQSFIVLHKDDWLYTGYGTTSRHSGLQLMASPGAWIIVRFWDPNEVSSQQDDDRIYLADGMLERLAQENSGLPPYQGTFSSPKQARQPNHQSFQRWRSTNRMQNAVPIPGIPQNELFGLHEYVSYQPGSKVVQTAANRFTIAVWDRAQISPMQVLWQCIAQAKREGYKVFKLENWAIDEPVAGTGTVWFRNTMDVVLQHQKEPNSLESVFEVDEVLSRMDANGAPLPR